MELKFNNIEELHTLLIGINLAYRSLEGRRDSASDWGRALTDERMKLTREVVILRELESRLLKVGARDV